MTLTTSSLQHRSILSSRYLVHRTDSQRHGRLAPEAAAISGAQYSAFCVGKTSHVAMAWPMRTLGGAGYSMMEEVVGPALDQLTLAEDEEAMEL
ncbi:LOW QUALITY PROTEIN: hypothetical protein SPRG_17438 [Saprolegnia parasitica CBS 223.65]|uniref:Uncharacterized protein n=1 Tax=Saprolegnia parasitica (strain CBS 223.65) TaxID=695850 RepID=A0A067BKF8_SAPPC|nr:LOW QUALITY PROTEIN: hypothetical protein SPRG_17438 [Saprolegnia parasitica CBS 223.65]KDO17170.1 LOW QUALITY PROTEIN: hypothetical protein SPRG_17438 [Saprolegnia parasitica CBS 223.65]|eukprot:XP_012212125.1 LOW QUALITY PROTEIN: hypothetical protein SPRG_17438 [Saprolegnia parasitica CBS 223.65]